MLDWQTGSSNVVLKTLVRFVAGIQPEHDGLWLQPAEGLPFEGFNFNINLKGCNLYITYENSRKAEGRYFIGEGEKTAVYSKSMKINRLWISNKELQSGDLRIKILD
ncbi:MAG: hypothetical protein K0R50_2116 [Eubacterium sp.]|nr:hypothetical protein [Eubacterium sp.]